MAILRPRTTTATLVMALFLAGVAAAAPPPIPPTPAAVDGVVLARPFTLERPFTYLWSAERPEVASGLVLVLAVAPDLVYPRQVAEPVLYVGDLPAMRVGTAYPSGRVVAIVPGSPEPLVWFGTPRLPEQVTAADAREERAAAEARGVARVPPPAWEAALDRGGRPLAARDLDELLERLEALR